MPILYPASLDSLTNPTSSDTLAGVPHAAQHSDENDAIEALETKVGVGASTPSTPGHVLRVTAPGATAYGAIQDGDLPATIARDSEITSAVSAHDADTTAVHGITDTSLLLTTSHEAAVDPHTGYQKESEKGAANGYASLGAGGLVPIAQIASGTPDGTKFVRDDGTLAVPAGGGLGAWTAYTPTWTATSVNPAIGNGSISGRYKALDSKTYAIQIKLAIGSTTTPGTGTWEFSLPSVTSGSFAQVLHGLIVDAGTRFYIATGVINNGSTKTNPILYQADSTGVGTVTHNTPITWASGDEIYLDGIIEVA